MKYRNFFSLKNKKEITWGVLLVIILAGSLYFVFEYQKQASSIGASRVWMEYAMNIVRDKKPTPPASANFYAYVSTVYYETLQETRNQDQANLSTGEIINFLYPDTASSTSKTLQSLNVKEVSFSEKTQEILSSYKLRIANDKELQKDLPVEPVGEEYWVGKNPLEPTAGKWRRWVVEGVNFTVPAPPVYNSPEYKAALLEVKNAMNINNTQAEAISFWGGAPGTEAPAGIWQNRLYTIVGKSSISDEKYAYAQMVLSQAIADSFLECWKVKYVYWTKRPSMGDPTIDLVWMANPGFPSYLSGHSTVSRTAAEVLSAMFPEYKEVWLRDAEEAKNSRLWAGIHFPYDNENGAELGRKVGQAVISNLKLTEIK